MSFANDLKKMPLVGSIKKAVQEKVEDDRKRRQEKEQQFMKALSHKYMLSLREKNIFSPKEHNLWEQITNESYVVTDADEKATYIAKEGLLLGSHRYKITNSEKNVIGYIRRHLFNIGSPFVKEKHGCTVKVTKNDEKFKLTTYLSLNEDVSKKLLPSFSFNEREFDVTGSTLGVTYEEGKKYAKAFKITKGKKTIAHIYKMSRGDGFFASRYIIGYDDKENEDIAVLISLAIHLIMYAA